LGLELPDEVSIVLQGDQLRAVPATLRGIFATDLERYAPCAGAQLQHRALRGPSQLLPQRQVCNVGAEFDLLPDPRPGLLAPVGVGRHCQKSAARPRWARSVRSSSSAV